MAEDLRRRHGITGPDVERRERDLRRRAARSAIVLGRRALAVRLLAAMATHGQLRQVGEVVGDAVPAATRVRDRRRARRGLASAHGRGELPDHGQP
jgi:hypothetical protein